MVRFGDFLATLAASSYVCCALRPAIPRVRLSRHEWPELAGICPSKGELGDTRKTAAAHFGSRGLRVTPNRPARFPAAPASSAGAAPSLLAPACGAVPGWRRALAD